MMRIFQAFLCVRGLKENIEHTCNWVLHIQQKLQVTLIKRSLSPLVQLILACYYNLAHYIYYNTHEKLLIPFRH